MRDVASFFLQLTLQSHLKLLSNGIAPPVFHRIGELCFLSGVTNMSSPTTSYTTLPENCHPNGTVALLQQVDEASAARVDVTVGGAVKWISGTVPSYVAFNSLHFPTSDSAMVPIPLAKPWTTYGQGFNDPSYVKYGDHLNE